MNQSCRVCGEIAAGYHFGAFTCEGCKSFFGRTYNNRSSIGECKNNNLCIINKKNRTSCKSCRLKKCFSVGMSKSGSRYGRRSNWFKIHCLLQDQNLIQQQQQQQQQQQHTQLPLHPQDHHQQLQLRDDDEDHGAPAVASSDLEPHQQQVDHLSPPLQLQQHQQQHQQQQQQQQQQLQLQQQLLAQLQQQQLLQLHQQHQSQSPQTPAEPQDPQSIAAAAAAVAAMAANLSQSQTNSNNAQAATPTPPNNPTAELLNAVIAAYRQEVWRCAAHYLLQPKQ